MNPDDDQLRLLAEIRDTVREHLSEYKRVTAKILEAQRLAASRVVMFSIAVYILGIMVGLLVIAIWNFGR
jgi:hypothetical protein